MEIKKWVFGLVLMLIVISIPSLYFIDGLMIPFIEELNFYVDFLNEEDVIKRYAEQREHITDLDKKSFILFVLFQISGALIIPILFLFIYFLTIPPAVEFGLRKVGLFQKENIVISRKAIIEKKDE